MKTPKFESDLDGVLIFCKYVTIKGRRIYPRKGKCFCFWIKKKK